MDTTSSIVKERLIEEIARLPEDKLSEVLDFVGYLLSKAQQAAVKEADGQLSPAQDPILTFIGGVSHGSLAKGIDNELYGE